MTERRRLTRGEFLRLAAAGGIAGALGGAGAARAAEPIATRPIPRTGEALPVIGLGTARVFDVGRDPAVIAERKKVLRLLLAGGGKVIDTAPSYGRAEAVVGEVMAALGARGRVFLATKVSSDGRAEGIAQMEGSMARLRTRRVDLLQVHNLIDTRTQLATLRAWKEEGRVRYIGVTHYRPEAEDDLARVIETEPLDFVQVNYSLGVRSAERRLLPLAAEKGVAVITNLPFMRARLFRAVRGRTLPDWAKAFGCASWAQLFLKYPLSNPAVTCVIPGMDKPAYVVDNLGAGRGRMPDAAERRRMVALAESL